MSKTASAPIDWLLEGEPYIEYRTRLDLLNEAENRPDVKKSRQAMLADRKVQALVSELTNWPGTVIASHRSASQPFHKLAFLADLGLRSTDLGVTAIADRVMAHQSGEGPFQLPVNVATGKGAAGRETWAWALCDAPLSVYALTKFGLGEQRAVKVAAAYLAALARSNGWPCAVSKELGDFRGPGRKDDPCPFATLATLKALSESDKLRDGPACKAGAETLLNLWGASKTDHPYMFFMGTDFRKLKAPLIWYDLVHVLDVLSRFEWLRQDKRLRSMLSVLKKKADTKGRFTVESVWTAWKDWEFGQKKVPSRWLTFVAWRIIGRVEGAVA